VQQQHDLAVLGAGDGRVEDVLAEGDLDAVKSPTRTRVRQAAGNRAATSWCESRSVDSGTRSTIVRCSQ
jgi:hypothetical protein